MRTLSPTIHYVNLVPFLTSVLLAFADESPAFVEINTAYTGFTSAMLEGNCTLENISILSGVGAGGIRGWDTENVAKLG